MSNPQYSFENLTHGKLLNIASKDDRNISLQLDVFGGNLSLVIFTGAGAKPWKQTISPKFLSEILFVIKKFRNEPRTGRETFGLMNYDPEAKRFNTVGQLAFGFDETMTFCIDVQHNELNGRHMFPWKRDGRIDSSNTSLSEKETIQANLDTIIRVLEREVPVALRMSSFKRAPGAAGGKPGFNNGGGGNRNYNNNGGGGGYNNNRQNNNASGGNSGSPFSGGGDDDILTV